MALTLAQKLPTIPEASRLRPVVDLLNLILVSLVSATARKFLLRLFCFLLVLGFYFVAGRAPGQAPTAEEFGVGVTPVNLTLAYGSDGI